MNNKQIKQEGLKRLQVHLNGTVTRNCVKQHNMIVFVIVLCVVSHPFFCVERLARCSNLLEM